MFTSSTTWLAILTSAQLAQGYADFGTVTAPCNFEPIFATPRPKFVPEDVYMRYESYSSSITAIAPSLHLRSNGTETSWSLHFVDTPTRTTRTADSDLRRRGVFSGDPPVPTCRQCDRYGNPLNGISNSNSTNTSGAPHCSITNYDGVFRDGAPSTSSTPSYCFNSGYTGPLVPTPVPTDAGLPCCPLCFPINTNGTMGTNGTNTSFTATTGVFSPTTTPTGTGTRKTSVVPGASGTKSTTSKTVSGTKNTTSKAIQGNTNSKETVTVIATKPVTITQVTLSIETITPTSTTGTPTIITGFNTIIGCGTASGCGTVIGSGTVYLAPFGYPAVSSSGTVSGCAPKIIGCGTMIATRGIFTAPPDHPATITACGEGTGSATLIGSGTVWPAGFNDQVSFVSSGTLTGSGRVKGCGVITGYGTFTVSEGHTGVITPAPTGTGIGGGEVATVNVYVSYCPGEMDGMGIGGLRLAGNFSGDGGEDSSSLANLYTEDEDAHADDDISTNRYALNAIFPYDPNSTSLYTNSTTNSTLLNATIPNPLCHICPQDSGICCPPFTGCGTDGHCPWTALEGCGYALYGFNIVNSDNSSGLLGMGGVGVSAKLKAPGLPGSGDGGGSADSAVSESDNETGTGSGTQDPTATTDGDSTSTSTDIGIPTTGPTDPSTSTSTPSPSSQKLGRRFKGQPKPKSEADSDSKTQSKGQKLNDKHHHHHERELTHRFAFAHFHGH